MKQIALIVLCGLVIFSACEKDDDPIKKEEPQTMDSAMVSMGAGYASDVFFSFTDSVVDVVERNNWDIAFSTDPMSSTVLINEGSGAELYHYPNGAIGDWDNVDTAGMYSWDKLYNSDNIWMYGAFDQNDLGHPDYGWGVYNSVNHDVIGDSIFIIKLVNGEYKKIIIEERTATSNTFSFKYANLDNTSEVETSINCSNYLDKYFIYYSIESEMELNREPVDTTWDIVFTKYHDESIPYIVTGVLSNPGVETAEVRDTPFEDVTASMATFSDTISIIGSDWKSFNMGTFSYDIISDLTYLIKDKDENIFKFQFYETDGSASGSSKFRIEKLED